MARSCAAGGDDHRDHRSRGLDHAMPAAISRRPIHDALGCQRRSVPGPWTGLGRSQLARSSLSL